MKKIEDKNHYAYVMQTPKSCYLKIHEKESKKKVLLITIDGIVADQDRIEQLENELIEVRERHAEMIDDE